MSKPQTRRTSRGFTLTELLIVIAIIVVLMALLVPTVGRVRTAAVLADSQQRLNNLRTAIEHYYADHHAYPGLFSNDQIRAGVPIMWDAGGGSLQGIGALSMTENMLMSLTGGLRQGAGAGVVVFDPTEVGKGQIGFNLANPKRYPAYIDAKTAGAADQPWVFLNGGSLAGEGLFYTLNPNPDTVADSYVPEPLDSFSDAMPFIYLRARVGAAGTIDNIAQGSGTNAAFRSTASVAQYDLRQAAPYGLWWRGADDTGAGEQVERGGTSFVVFDKSDFPAGAGYLAGYQSYFASDLSSVATPTPKQKDTYILIGAGADRRYGTKDDQTNYGNAK